jgi:cation diffusion facilitator CzcD-associated flavoprotein CzcO
MGSIAVAHEPEVGEHLPNGLLNQWHSQPRKPRIIHVGAGATGLCAAFKMERQLTDYELVLYEKNDEIGGTWYDNRYPGLCV